MDESLAAEKLADLSQRAKDQQKKHFARQPKKAADVVAQLIAKRGYGAVKSNQQLATSWASAVGPAMAQVSQPSGIRRGVLEVTVANSVMMQELTFDKHALLSTMQRALPEAGIKQLRFRVGSL